MHDALDMWPIPPIKYLQILSAWRWAHARELNGALKGKRKFMC